MNTDNKLDVRPVEPKNRFETIMSAYHGLEPGQTFELIVDHDPKCMYYTLLADYGPDAFAFDYLEQGPETWRVNVERKNAANL